MHIIKWTHCQLSHNILLSMQVIGLFVTLRTHVKLVSHVLQVRDISWSVDCPSIWLMELFIKCKHCRHIIVYIKFIFLNITHCQMFHNIQVHTSYWDICDTCDIWDTWVTHLASARHLLKWPHTVDRRFPTLFM